MISLIFCVSAVVAFTIGFRLVKQGKPYTRQGGDTFNKRKRRRVIGWIFWAMAFELVILATVNMAGSLQPGGEGMALAAPARA